MKRAVIGFDLSLRRSAAVYLPPNWIPGSWRGVKWHVVGGDVEGRDQFETVKRLAKIAGELIGFYQKCRDGLPDGAESPAVFVEDHAYGLAARSGMGLAELHGAVKLKFYEATWRNIEPMNQSTARKIFLGKLPPKHRAEYTLAAVMKLDPPWGKGDDEADALVIANAGRSTLGMVAMTDCG